MPNTLEDIRKCTNAASVELPSAADSIEGEHLDEPLHQDFSTAHPSAECSELGIDDETTLGSDYSTTDSGKSVGLIRNRTASYNSPYINDKSGKNKNHWRGS
jgi:hypothetical protein